MDHQDFLSHIKYINFNGVTLNIEEKQHLDLALQKMRIDFSFDEILFWGKIFGKCIKQTFTCLSFIYLSGIVLIILYFLQELLKTTTLQLDYNMLAAKIFLKNISSGALHRIIYFLNCRQFHKSIIVCSTNCKLISLVRLIE